MANKKANLSDRGKYFKSILTLLSGSMVAQIFTVICSPILTRICSPEDLGTFTLVTGAITMFGMVMSLRYELCIVSEPDDEKAFSLINLSMKICACISMLIFIGYFFYFSTRSFENNSIVLALVTAALSFLLGIINIVTAYNNRHKQYKLITTTYILRVFCQNIGNLLAGFLHFGAIGLSLSQLLGYFAGVRGQAKPLLKYKDRILKAEKETIKQVAYENKKQPLLSAPATFANGLSYSLINYFIEGLFTTTLVGFYSISYRILGLPLTLVSGNVSKVFMERAAKEKKEKGNFKSVYLFTVFMMTIIAVPMAICLMIFSPTVCEVFLGKGWHVAGEYIRLMTPMMMLRFVAGGVNCAAIVANKQQYDLVIQIALSLTAGAVFVIAKVKLFSIETFLTLLSVCFSLIYIVYIYLFWLCAKDGSYNDDYEIIS